MNTIFSGVMAFHIEYFVYEDKFILLSYCMFTNGTGDRKEKNYRNYRTHKELHAVAYL